MKSKMKFLNKGIFLTFLLVVFLLAGCSNEKETSTGAEHITSQESENVASESWTIKDTTGEDVEVKKNIERIAIVPIPWTSIVYAIDGSSERIVGMHPTAKTSYDECILKNLAPVLGNVSTEFVGKDFTINMEESGKLNLDAMIVWDYQEKEIEQLKGLGIPAIALKYGTLDDLQNGMLVIGKLLGKEEKAEKLVAYHKEAIDYFNSKKSELKNVKKPRVLYLRDDELKVAGGGAVNTEFIEMAGGENVAKELNGQWVNVTMEQIMAWNPEIIIMSNFSKFKPEDIINNTIEGQDWSNIDAVKNNRVLKAPMGLYRWDAPCAETPLMIKWLAKELQPTVFGDIDLENEIKLFYADFLNYELSEDEVDKILQTKMKGK